MGTSIELNQPRTVHRVPRGPRMTIKVDQNMLDTAIRRDSGHCMIADAVKAAYLGARFVAVDIQTIRFTDRALPLRYTYLTPRIAQVALIKFDQGENQGPFQFLLRGAHVTATGSLTGRSLETRVKKREFTPRLAAALQKAALVQHHGVSLAGNGHALDRFGGKPPPVMTKGRRRAFGLRGLGL